MKIKSLVALVMLAVLAVSISFSAPAIAQTGVSYSYAALKNPIATLSPAQGRTYITGPRGGCYYINRNGNKTYVDRSFCGRNTKGSTPSGYIRGPRGGCYYINRNGNKTYVDRSLCNR